MLTEVNYCSNVFTETNTEVSVTMEERMKITLRAARVNANMTATEVAKIVGIKRQSIYNYESGRNSPNMKLLSELLKLYKVKFEDLILPGD